MTRQMHMYGRGGDKTMRFVALAFKQMVSRLRRTRSQTREKWPGKEEVKCSKRQRTSMCLWSLVNLLKSSLWL